MNRTIVCVLSGWRGSVVGLRYSKVWELGMGGKLPTNTPYGTLEFRQRSGGFLLFFFVGRNTKAGRIVGISRIVIIIAGRLYCCIVKRYIIYILISSNNVYIFLYICRGPRSRGVA